MMDAESDFIKLPLEERCIHKNWKARVHGYEELKELFQNIDEKKVSECSKYLGLIKKFVSDSNVAAQEKGLEASLVYIDNAFVAAKTVGEVMPMIVTKCLGATKAKIKGLATQISLMYIEIGKQDIVIDELLKGTEQKNPKISAGCVNTLTQALREFGCKVIDIKSIMKKSASLLEDRDKNVREEAKVLTVELFKWISNPEVIKTHLKSLKSTQLRELESEFDKVKHEKPVILRYLKSQQAKQSKLGIEHIDVEIDIEDIDEDDDTREIDPLDLFQAVDILSKLPKDFYEKLQEKKWQERKEALDNLEELLNNVPKLEAGDYSHLVRAIKKVIIKDSNVILVGIAARCMAMLAKGLKKKFQSYAPQCLLPLLEKFKEKKQNVVLPLREAVDAIYDSTTIEIVQEDVIASMKSKNPAVRAETVDFLARCFTKCNFLILNKKLLKTFSTALLKTFNDSDPLVRDNSAKAIGTAWKVVGEKVISPFLKDVFEDSSKIAKIKNECDNAIILAKPPKPVNKKSSSEPVVKKSKVANKPFRETPRKTATFKKSSSTTSLNQKSSGILKKSLSMMSLNEKLSVNIIPKGIVTGNEVNFSDEDNYHSNVQNLVARVDISSKISQNLINELTHKDWKIKTEAINKFQLIVDNTKYITSNLGEAVPVITERLTDRHDRVALATFALCESIAVAMGPLCKIFVRDILPAMLQGLRDKKRSAAALSCINTWGNTAGFKEFFQNEMIATALKAESPILRIELWKWLAEKLPEIKSVPKDELSACLPRLYEHLVLGNLEVRKNAIHAVHGFMIHLSYETMIQTCEKLKPADSNTIKGFLDRAQSNLPDLPAAKSNKPSSGLSSTSTHSTASKPEASVVAEPKAKNMGPVMKKVLNETVESDVLLKANPILKMQRGIDENIFKVLRWNFSVPREEFVKQLKEQMDTAGVDKILISNMFHINFKFHLKAIDCLSEDLESNLPALISNFDLILKWLTLRFFDTNPAVILRGLEYLISVFNLLAENGYNMTENEASSFLPYLVLKIGDPKDCVRARVRDIFDAVGLVYPISKLFTFIMDGIKSKNARQRTACLNQLGRLIENYGLSVCQPSPATALKEIAKRISDHDNSVRNAALNCIVSTYFIAGEKVRQMIGKISDKDMSLLDEGIKRAWKTRSMTAPMVTVKPNTCSSENNISCTDSLLQELNNTYEVRSDDEMQSKEDVCGKNEGKDVEQMVEPAVVTPSGDIPTKRKQFGLDSRVMDAIESIHIVNPELKLAKYDSSYFIDQVTPQQPVGSNHSFSTQTVVKIPSQSSPRKTNTLEYLIIRIGALTSVKEVMGTINQLSSALEDEEKRKELNGLETQLIMQVIKFLGLINNLDGSGDPTIENSYTCALSLLKLLFSFQNHASKISDMCLKQLLNNLFNLLEEKISQEEKWKTVIKLINNSVFKILKHSEHVAIICSLLQMLYDSVAISKSTKAQQRIIFCVWRTIKLIPMWDAEGVMDYHKILCEVDRFLTDFPSIWWKMQLDDTPIRTYRTLVHAIVKIRGIDILVTAHSICGHNEQSELSQYINKLLKHMQEETTDDNSKKMKSNVTHSQRDELEQILKKIARLEESEKKEGLRMLHNFMKNYPKMNIKQFLTKMSPYFQRYVAAGLENLRSQKESGSHIFDTNPRDKYGCSNGISSANGNNLLGLENSYGDSSESDAECYQQKLKALQVRAGYHNYKKGAHGDGTVTLKQIREKLSQLRTGN